MGYTAGQIVVEGIPVEQVEYMEFSERAGEHGCLTLRGYVKAKDSESFPFDLPPYAPLTIRAEDKILFSGIIMKRLVTGEGEGDGSRVQVTAYTRSILLDQVKRCRSFQDITITYKELAELVLKEYPDSDLLMAFPDLPIRSIAVQYQETDWQFLKRMFSCLNLPLTGFSTSEALKLYAGVPILPDTSCAFETIGFRKELGEYYYWKELGEPLGDDLFLILEGRTEEVIGLFEQVEAKGQRLSVREHGFRLEHGRIVGTCGIQKPEGIRVKREYPTHLIGAALEGTVGEVSGTQLRVHLKIDEGRDGTDVYWFPFSTLSASSDGSGWYYMPEQGDRVRIYFPTKDTKDAIAISAVSDYREEGGAAPDRMGDPSTKYLSHPSGQELRMGKDGITLSCRGGAASVVIGAGGDISLYAEDTLLVQASNQVEVTSETEMEFSAANTAVVACAMGGCLQMRPDGMLMLQGTEVNVD